MSFVTCTLDLPSCVMKAYNLHKVVRQWIAC